MRAVVFRQRGSLPRMPEERWRLHRFRTTVDGEPLHTAITNAVPGLSRTQARQAVAGGLVRIEGKPADASSAPVPAGVWIEADLRQGVRTAFVRAKHGGGGSAPDARPFEIIHQDSQLVVVDKNAGVLSMPTRKTTLGVKAERGAVPELLRRLWKARGEAHGYIGMVHRLDRDTSGCLVFARGREAQRILAAQFAGEAAGRVYRCLVWGVPPRADSGEIRGRQGHGKDGKRDLKDEDEDGAEGKEAITRWKVVRRFRLGAELEVELGTGRTHQIRVAMAHMGCSVVGDRLYGEVPRTCLGLHPERLMLHAWRLGLDHPSTGKRLTVEAPLPACFEEWAERLENGPEQVVAPVGRPLRVDGPRQRR
jgi:23S rRNA pseudouridine1911/1915/1917 synthase